MFVFANLFCSNRSLQTCANFELHITFPFKIVNNQYSFERDIKGQQLEMLYLLVGTNGDE